MSVSSPRIVGVIAHDEKGGECITHSYINYVCIRKHTKTNTQKNLVRKPGRKRQVFKPKLRWKLTIKMDRLKRWEDFRILRNYRLTYRIGGSFLSSWITTSFFKEDWVTQI